MVLFVLLVFCKTCSLRKAGAISGYGEFQQQHLTSWKRLLDKQNTKWLGSVYIFIGTEESTWLSSDILYLPINLSATLPPMYWQHCSSLVAHSRFSSKCSWAPCASSAPQISQLGNRFSIFNINQNTFLISYFNLFPILACSDWNNYTVTIIYLLNQNKLKSELILSCQAKCYPLSQLRSRLDVVKVIHWGYLLYCSNRQNLFSITAAVEEKMDSMCIDRYWFGNFWGTNKMASQLFNCFYLPWGNVFLQFLDKQQLLKLASWSISARM